MTTPDHTALTDAEREALLYAVQRPDLSIVAAVKTILAARLAAVETVRDHYRVLAGLPVSASGVADRLDVALGGGE